ncbi:MULTISPECIES: mycofactocin-coupled SDR family oxidoreductase [Mycolicibacterium]|uniref:Short-chain dehydrogenase/reductase SDR n=2 Tax=Mycolicibacterium TaxID=1866885 RepID=A1T951_MYCVP|nr:MULTISPECIES: mycofactocin-coupled SDR family oxidoreductase [Mycolicibacterium]ABM13701.1 short-chain dehydrogenase/reductase SDR [Mycolicibacterium vanbaalenii PYR-1]MCV7126565.1 mycofactocin-coupled SDR family oxidoreductase [Mycolicibacterium vanbaalenii PYR-1]MDN4520100.1 mycofactocin-coupled SDR family oxidoreductase [Mycolicibacterium austroafricanum]PQP47357.1 NAD(P)-dependent oxidoreductase [Mycolicibacterium austroafricanum]QRZ09450.1 mycofactocin-coupled SDR family oxidoreductase
MAGLHGKVAVVTGAARGTGRAHCERLADAGADVIAIDIGDLDELAATAESVTDRGRRCITGAADVRDFDGLAATVAASAAELGGLDIVVANAGIHTAGAPTWKLSAQAWRDTLDVNLTGVWHTVKASVPHLGAAGGSIVIISSTNGIRGTANTAHYTATKHAVVGLARTLANELGPRSIRVNTVHPGAVATPTVRNEATYRRLCPDIENPTESDAARVLAARNLLPVPWVEPVDVANAVCFLASDQARYITGTQLVVDAGLTQKA